MHVLPNRESSIEEIQLFNRYIQDMISLANIHLHLIKYNYIPISINTITRQYENFSLVPSISKARVVIVYGFDIMECPKAVLFEDAISQVASQFNFLESMGPNYSDITTYLRDPTQGPRASLPCLSSLIIRDHLFKPDGLQSAQILFRNSQEHYKNGYLELFKYNGFLEEYYNYLKSNIDSLNIFAQWGIPEYWKGDSVKHGKGILQVFNAAPSFQGKAIPSESSFETKICKLLVTTQYEAIGKLAVMRYLVTKTNVKVHLTLVGQSSYNNHISVIQDAIDKFLNIIKDYDIDAFFHIYDKLTDISLSLIHI